MARYGAECRNFASACSCSRFSICVVVLRLCRADQLMSKSHGRQNKNATDHMFYS